VTPEEFQAKWGESTLGERQAAQSHFLDLCALLDVPTPTAADATGAEYCFERPVTKTAGGKGFVDVWKRNCFAWEYKGSLASLVRAQAQVKQYLDALDNPPLAIVSDLREIWIRTNFTGKPVDEYRFTLADLTDPGVRRQLRAAFLTPYRFEPTRDRARVTADAAEAFGIIAASLRATHEPQRVAHFLNRIVFCLFAEDIELLPNRVFAEILELTRGDVELFVRHVRALFQAMTERNGYFGTQRIPWVNGGLFDDDDVLPLGPKALAELANAARLDWSAIEPSIFGTLFERGLDPAKREQMASLFDAGEAEAAPARAGTGKGVGIHYTDSATIMKIVEPVVLRPWRREWEETKAAVAALRARKAAAKAPAQRTRIEGEIRAAWLGFRERLGRYRVLDPACGSGNFLYLALLHLKDFDRAVQAEARGLDLPPDDDRVTPDSVLGIEINPYAAELARTTIWIGELQWQTRNSGPITRAPVLGRLDGIENRDALLDGDQEAAWPQADAIIGNPPFLGTKRMFGLLGTEYTDRLRRTYEGYVSPFADLVCFWFEKARRLVVERQTDVAGLVATNSIRGGKNRLVLDKIVSDCTIYDAWSDLSWTIDGAAVRVSLVAFCRADDPLSKSVTLDGGPVLAIFPDLTAQREGRQHSDLTKAKRIRENKDVGFVGTVKAGKFDVSGETARQWLLLPTNPNHRPNSDVLVPWQNGLDVVRRPQDLWIVDFGTDRTLEEAALFEAPFQHIRERVLPKRSESRRQRYRDYWWLQAEPCIGMRKAVGRISRFIVTPTVAKHRLFTWRDSRIQPDHQLIAIARDDDTTFGILHSRFHELWALRLGTSLEDRPRYTPSTTFETFPFPAGLTPDIPAADYAADPRAQAIAAAAKRLDDLREAWLNPADLVKRVPEVVPGYPDRILPVNARAAAELKKRTLTNLYNARPQWLADAHRALDAAVAAAYGWPADIADDEALARLFALNQERAAR